MNIKFDDIGAKYTGLVSDETNNPEFSESKAELKSLQESILNRLKELFTDSIEAVELSVELGNAYAVSRFAEVATNCGNAIVQIQRTRV
jgi:hypothetical protein